MCNPYQGTIREKLKNANRLRKALQDKSKFFLCGEPGVDTELSHSLDVEHWASFQTYTLISSYLTCHSFMSIVLSMMSIACHSLNGCLKKWQLVSFGAWKNHYTVVISKVLNQAGLSMMPFGGYIGHGSRKMRSTKE